MEKLENLKCLEKFEVTPIGTKGYLNVNGKIYAVRLSRYELEYGRNPLWPALYNVWETPNGEKFLSREGGNSIYLNKRFINISNSVDVAKTNEKGDFPYRIFSTYCELCEKYGLKETNFSSCTIYLYKMVNGFASSYEPEFTMELVNDEIVVTIPDIENKIGFVTKEECLNAQEFEIIDFDDDDETPKKMEDDEEIVFKVTAKKSDLTKLKELGIKIEC